MYKLLVNFAGGQIGDDVIPSKKGTSYMIHSYGLVERYLCLFEDLPTLISCGIVEEVQTPKWTSKDVLSIIAFLLKTLRQDDYVQLKQGSDPLRDLTPEDFLSMYSSTLPIIDNNLKGGIHE